MQNVHPLPPTAFLVDFTLFFGRFIVNDICVSSFNDFHDDMGFQAGLGSLV